MRLGCGDLRARVVATAGAADHLRALHRLGIDDRRRRRRLPPGRGAYPVAQVIVHPHRRPVCLPLVRPPVHGPGGREVGRQRPPHRPVMGEVADRVDDVPPSPPAPPPPPPPPPTRPPPPPP